MDNEPSYHIDIPGLEESSVCPDHDRNLNRPWIGVRFECCDVYTRVYRNHEGTAYTGQCPKCRRPVTFRVGPGGTDSRFFLAR